jgi:hypothetical protein
VEWGVIDDGRNFEFLKIRNVPPKGMRMAGGLARSRDDLGDIFSTPNSKSPSLQSYRREPATVLRPSRDHHLVVLTFPSEVAKGKLMMFLKENSPQLAEDVASWGRISYVNRKIQFLMHSYG